MANYGTPPDESSEQDDNLVAQNPIVEVNLTATENDRLFFRENPEEQYIGLYHRHYDGTLMIGAGVLDAIHELIPEEVIFRKFIFEDIKETREVVSDLIYKLWFNSYTLTDEEVLATQTTLRDGIRQIGRSEDEPLVFFKKDRNALESSQVDDDQLESIFQYIFDNNIVDLEPRFDITQTTTPTETNQTRKVWTLKFFDLNQNLHSSIVLAVKEGDVFLDALNLSQITKIIGSSSKINPEKAREVLDTNIFELLPNQPNRQQRINNFFTEFNELIGPKPGFRDVDGDGIGERVINVEQDEQLRISTADDKRSAFITRTDEQSLDDSQNQGKTLESMRNKLNTYLGDVDNVIENFEDQRPEYENVSEGFLKIRKPNQAIIVRAPDDGLLEFQKNDSYLNDGFTITMWVKFTSRTSEGTLFNFGNPLQQVTGRGFRLDTKTNNYNGKDYRYIRLMVRDNDGELYDNHWGTNGYNRFSQRSRGGNANTVAGAYGWYTNPTGDAWTQEPVNGYIDRPRSYYPDLHRAFPQVSTDDLDEWYFICATYNPNINEISSTEAAARNVRQDTQFWLNHVKTTDNNGVYEKEIVAFSGEGARCKVELISRTDLLNARGFKGSSFSISTSYSAVSGSIDVNGDIDFTLSDIYQDTSLLDEDGSGSSGDDGDGESGSSGGGNPPTAGFSKADMDWRTYEVGDVQDTTQEQQQTQG
tara:strand:+ start:32 stop:2140 length:2109 start_codon:yes stop_codon:yes gene_type:complete